VAVFVLDRRGRPLMPCTEKRGRELCESGRARVHRLFPFTLRLVDRSLEDSVLQPLRLGLDPGSITTGLSISRVGNPSVNGNGPVMHIRFLMELIHRGAQIRDLLRRRSMFRHGRRTRNLRFRVRRFNNRGRKKGSLPPSLKHRVETSMTWVGRLKKLAPITELAQELVRFDTKKLQTPEVEAIEYQRGTLDGFEVGEYLLAKWGRKCAYCDKTGVPLEKEHIVPRARGGSNRVSNLTLSCRPCNLRKAAKSLDDFLKKDPVRAEKIKAQTKAPLRDAAAVSATKNSLLRALIKTGLPTQTGTGGQTKYNRVRLKVPKTHALDAACVGVVGELRGVATPALQIKCQGRGSRSRTRLDTYGFPRGVSMSVKMVHGFRTGDMVRAVVVKGKKTGVHVGRVAVRAEGTFNVQTRAGTIQGIWHKSCKLLARGDGYAYAYAWARPASS